MPGKRGTPIVGIDCDDEQRLLSQLMTCGIPEAVYFKDLRRRYVRLNEAEASILGGIDPRMALGKTADEFMSSRHARAWRQEETELLVTGEPLVDRVEKVMREDGTVRWFSATKVPLRNRDGAVTGLVGTTRDVTRRKLEEQRKEQFIATISHELRTPVTSIMSALALVTSGAAGTVPESAIRLLMISSANCQRLVNLINDILDLEKAGSGMMVFDVKSIDVVKVVEQEIASIRSYAEPYGVNIRLDGTYDHALTRADPARLAQVLSNLLSNASKYSPRGADVVVGIERRHSTIRITVRDYGPGIPDAYRDRVFDKFIQVNGEEPHKRGGTGLGLSIVKEIVGHLKGDVGYEPAPGGGSIFYVTLPLDETYGLNSRAGTAFEGP